MTDKNYIGPIITRAEALSTGLPRYFTGKPCRNGHLCERTVAGWSCLGCKSDDSKRRRLSDPDAKEKDRVRRLEKAEDIKRYKKKYNDANKPLIAQTCRIYYDSNKERILARNAEYARENPDVGRSIRQNRRARKLSADGCYTQRDVQTILRLQRRKCAECRSALKSGYEVDHIVPLALGGANKPSNLQLLCMPCNRRKGAKHPIVWASERGRLL